MDKKSMRKVYYCFPQGKHKVFTLSYDDGRCADRRLIEIMNRHGIRGTFHLNAGLMGSHDRIPKEEVSTLYQGHEVAAHTYNHPTIARSPREELIDQVMQDRKELEALVGYPVRGMSYPNGSYNQRIIEALPHLGIEYSRVVGGHQTYQLPDNFYTWQATCHHNRQGIERAKEFVELHKTQYLYMLYIWGHSYEFDNDDNWETIEEICRIVGNQEDIWYATNIEIVDYLKALDRLQFNTERTQVLNASHLTLWLDVDGKKTMIQPGLNVL
ncbi:polysaccharide deacetylase family protein [Vallitaleaceae bacterium 9-2]